MDDIDDVARATYLALQAGPRPEPDLAAALQVDETQVGARLQQLESLGVAERLVEDGTAAALPPAELARLVEHHEASLERHVREAQALRTLLRAARAQEESLQRRHFLVHHTSAEKVRRRLVELSDQATDECVSLNPGRSLTVESIAASQPLNQESLERGVTIRSIYQEAYGNDARTLANLRWTSDLGGRLRTLPLVPFKLVIVDRAVAIVPSAADEPEPGAFEIHNEVLVSLLYDYFERLWAVARVPGARHRHLEPGTASEPDPTIRQLLELLAAGDTDAAAARRLGLSERTVRRMMAGVMKELGATSRLQAGVEAVRRGWL